MAKAVRRENSINILLLDDENIRRDKCLWWFKKHLGTALNITHVKTVDELREELKDEGYKNFDYISLDHDLGDQQTETGLHAVRWIIEQRLSPPNIFVHSMNPVGAMQMVDELRYSGLEVTVQRVIY